MTTDVTTRRAAGEASPRSIGRIALIRRQSLFEFRLIMRNGEQFLLTLLIPVILLVGLTQASAISLGDTVAGTTERAGLVVPGVLALAVMSTAFTAQAIATGFDRRSGALKFIGATPLQRSGLVWSKTLTTLLMLIVQFGILIGVALVLGWDPVGPLWSAGLLVAVGAAAFSTLGLALAGTLRAEATLAAANGIYLLLLLGGGIVVPLADMPAPMATVAAALPSGALGEGLREILTDGVVLPWGRLLVLLAWAVVGSFIAVRSFKWE